MTSDTQDDTGESGRTDNAILKRRDVIAGLGAAGIFAAAASGQSQDSVGATIGGGPMSSEVSHLQIEWTEGARSERPDAGVENRYFRVDDRSDAEFGTIYRDDGSSWQTVDIGVGSLEAEELNNTVHSVSAGSSAAEINAVISAASDGDTVRLERGTYTISEPITDQGKNNITLEADGMGGAVIEVAAGSQETAIALDAVDDWEIRYLEIDGQAANEADGGESTKQCGIYAEDCNRLWVHHNYIHDTFFANFRAAARAGSASDVLVAHNILDTTYGPAPADSISFTASDGLEYTACNSIANHCLNNGHQSIEYSSNVNDSIVANNMVVDCESVGLSIHDGKRVTVVGNSVIGSATGITIVGTDYLATGNYVADARGQGIKIGDPGRGAGRCAAVGNYVDGCGNRGLNLNATKGVAVGNVVLNAARSSATADGIRADGDKCVVVGNIVDTVVGRDGIRINRPDCTVANNLVNEPSEHGISARGARGQFDSNKILNPGQDDSTAVGITVQDTHCDVSGNHVEGSPSQGIRIREPFTKVVDNRVAGSSDNIRVGADNNLIALNWLADGGSYGVILVDASSNLLASNYLYNNQTAIQMINPNNDCKDNRLEKNHFAANATKYDVNNSTRTVQNGVGRNGGDPSTGGDWNGNGFEGLLVRDTTNDDTYLFNAGGWSQIASA